jgi:hypothetical protein
MRKSYLCGGLAALAPMHCATLRISADPKKPLAAAWPRPRN